MADLTFAQLEGYWIAAGGSKALAPLMAAIALAESSGNPQATNPTDNGGTQTSWGLWQISNGTHSEVASNWNDPLENARLAVAKVKSQGLSAWGTYDSGAYKRYMDGNATPVTPPAGGGGSTSTGGSAGTPTSAGSIVGGWIGQISGADAISSMIGTVFGPIGNAFTNLDQALTTTMHAVLWMVNPMNWVRIIAGIVGAVCAIAGAVIIVKAG